MPLCQPSSMLRSYPKSVSILLLPALLAAFAFSQDVRTYHNNNSRTGLNSGRSRFFFAVQST